MSGALAHLKRVSKSPLLKMLCLTITVFIALDSILLLLECANILDEPYNWGYRPDFPYKINECKHLFSQNPGKFKIVIVGDSRPEMAFDPDIVDQYFHNYTISYNLALSGGGVLSHSVFIEKIILEKIQPDFIIWDVNFGDFEYGGLDHEEDTNMLSFPMGRYYTDNPNGLDFWGMVDFLLTKYSCIYRQRTNLAPDFINRLYIESIWSHKLVGFFARGQRRLWEGSPGGLSTGLTGIVPVLIDMYLNPPARSSFTNTIRILEEKAIPFCVIYGPFNHFNYTCPSLDPLLQSLPSRNFLNLNGNASLIDDSLYWNYYHLNKLGSVIYTNFVIQKIQALVPELDFT